VMTSIRQDAGGITQVPTQILLTTSGAATFDVVSDVLATPNAL